MNPSWELINNIRCNVVHADDGLIIIQVYTSMAGGMNWRQRVEEMSTNRVTKKICDREIPGKRLQGRPRKRWR